MSAFELLTKVGKFTKPYLGFSKLRHGHHEIEKFRLVKNKMYVPAEQLKPDEQPKLPRVLMVELKDQVLFMPEYITKAMGADDEKVAELNNDGVKKFLYFGGKRDNARSVLIMTKKYFFLFH